MSPPKRKPPRADATSRRIGVARALSKLGYCSRTQAATLVQAGRVSVDGRAVRDPEHPTTATSRLAVDGQPVAAAAKLYLMLNKPRGLVTTAQDEQGRPTVYDCLPPELRGRVAPVGRLDQASEGLLLFTNDTDWAHQLTSPAAHVPKTYHVQIDRVPDTALCAAIVSGITDDGEHLAAARCAILRTGSRQGWIEVTLTEGRNRHIRRMLAALGIETRRLVRVAIGGLTLGTLAKGACRALEDTDLQALQHPHGALAAGP